MRLRIARQKRIYEAVKKFQKVMLRLMVKLQSWQEMQRWQEQLGNALHKNRMEHIPCFRVVNAKGELNRYVCL